MLHVVLWDRRDGTDFCMHKYKQVSSLFIHIFLVPSDSQPDENRAGNIHNTCTYNVTQYNGYVQKTRLYPLFMFKGLLNVVTKPLVLLNDFTVP